jgi:hypothetical protein
MHTYITVIYIHVLLTPASCNVVVECYNSMFLLHISILRLNLFNELELSSDFRFNMRKLRLPNPCLSLWR